MNGFLIRAGFWNDYGDISGVVPVWNWLQRPHQLDEPAGIYRGLPEPVSGIRGNGNPRSRLDTEYPVGHIGAADVRCQWDANDCRVYLPAYVQPGEFTKSPGKRGQG